ncbi:hypothetical protein M0804_004413 [Polistes exclamans]|nr:hypothetical protein M0804_004413 [Polistes exclamans]
MEEVCHYHHHHHHHHHHESVTVVKLNGNFVNYTNGFIDRTVFNQTSIENSQIGAGVMLRFHRDVLRKSQDDVDELC